MYCLQNLVIAILGVILVAFAFASEEGSSEVCNVEGSTCPSNKCCRDEICGKEKDSEGLKCCGNPTIDPDRSNPQCANCPKCSECSNF